MRSSAALCRGLIEACRCGPRRRRPRRRSSAALCRGLIEARTAVRHCTAPSWGLPRLYAAASLKRCVGGSADHDHQHGLPRLYAAASLKPYTQTCPRASALRGLPRLYAAASLKPAPPAARRLVLLGGLPRLYAAASLKLEEGFSAFRALHWSSAALCRGLIEADPSEGQVPPALQGLPRLYAAASLKPRRG